MMKGRLVVPDGVGIFFLYGKQLAESRVTFEQRRPVVKFFPQRKTGPKQISALELFFIEA